jgi:hypothetical protein
MGQTEKNIMKKPSENIFLTRDLPLIGYLSLNGISFEDLVRKDTVVYFTFIRNNKLESMIKDYQNRRSLIEPISFWEEIKRIRRLIKNVLLNKENLI